MQGKGGCCIARCATGAHDMAKVQRIMMGFRPIAPKPNSVSSPENTDASPRSAGTKRKYNRGGKRAIRRRIISPPPAVTLPLLPETPDPKDPDSDQPEAKSRENAPPVWLGFENNGYVCGYGYSASAEKVGPPAAGSVVTVESVTDTWTEESEVMPLLRKLEEDTCPGFVSDGYGRVTWTNRAYREIVGEGGVWLVTTKEVRGVVPVTCGGGGFTCRVRVQDACGKERNVPCDVWRVGSGGGFAWRLDVTAALTLSLAL